MKSYVFLSAFRCSWGTCRWTWAWFSMTATRCCPPSRWRPRSVWVPAPPSSSCLCWSSFSCTGTAGRFLCFLLWVRASGPDERLFSTGGKANRRSEITRRFCCSWKRWRSTWEISAVKSSQVSGSPGRSMCSPAPCRFYTSIWNCSHRHHLKERRAVW